MNNNIHPILYKFFLILRNKLGAEIVHRRKRRSNMCIEIIFLSDLIQQPPLGRLNTLREAEECGYWGYLPTANQTRTHHLQREQGLPTLSHTRASQETPRKHSLYHASHSLSTLFRCYDCITRHLLLLYIHVLSLFCYPLRTYKKIKNKDFSLFLQKNSTYICKYHFFFVSLCV